MNLHYEKYLTLYDALFGLIFDLKTVDKRILRINLDPIVKLESALQCRWFTQIIKGEGISSPDGERQGDLHIDFKIIIPNLENPNDQILLKKMFLSSQKKLAQNKKVQEKNLEILSADCQT